MTAQAAEQFISHLEHRHKLLRDFLDPADRREAIERLTGASCFAGQVCCEPNQVERQVFDWAREGRRAASLESTLAYEMDPQREGGW